MKNFTCDIDVNPYIKNCEYDMCSHASVEFESSYLCRAMAAYAYDCAKTGKSVGQWLTNPILKSACSLAGIGVCPSGQQFMDCSDTCLKTCRDLSAVSDYVCGNGCRQGLNKILVDIFLKMRYFF